MTGHEREDGAPPTGGWTWLAVLRLTELLDVTLRRIVEAAAELVDARYGAPRRMRDRLSSDHPR